MSMRKDCSATMISSGFHPLLSTVCAFLAGLLAGLATGLLHTKLRIPALLSGILTMTALYSIKPGTNLDAVAVLRSVVVEEMLHITLVANLMNAIRVQVRGFHVGL